MTIRFDRRRPRLVRALLRGALCVCFMAAALPSRARADERTDPAGYREYDIGDGKVTFDVTEAPFGQVVAERIQPRTRVNILVSPDAASERVTLKVVDLHWLHALDAMTERINGVLVKKALNLLRVERPTPITITFKNAEIAEVIETIADSASANVIVSPLVKGQVTVSFKNAPWRAALEYVVETVGKYTLDEVDYGILRVVPTSDLPLVPDTYVFRYLRPPPPYKGVVKSGGSGGGAASGSTTTGGGTGGTATGGGADIIQSNVFVPSDDPAKEEEMFPIVKALRSIVAPENGTVSYIGAANAILFSGTRPHVARVRALCEQLDVEPPQIFIDMNFITTSNSDTLDMGLHSQSGLQVDFTGAGISHRLPFAAGGPGWADNVSGAPFPASTAPFTYGVLDFSKTDLLFQALKRDSCSKVVQAPKILALDNQEATIFVGESIRYARTSASSSQSGTLAFSVAEDPNSPVNVGFQLLVLPHVVPGENKIMMTVIPQQRALSGKTSPTLPGFDRFVFGTQTIDLPRVASSTLVTHMLLRNDETTVIDGLLEDREIEGRDKIPILGDLPLLNLLFGGVSKQKVKQHLLITITPRILRGSDAASPTISDEMTGRCCKNAAEWQTWVDGQRKSAAPCAPPPAAAPTPPPAPAPAPAPIPPPKPVPVAPSK